MRKMNNLSPNITGFTVLGEDYAGTYTDVEYKNRPEYLRVKEELKWLLKCVKEDKRTSFINEECHLIIDFNTAPTLVHIHKSYQSYCRGFMTPYPYLVIKKEKKKMYFDYHDTRCVFPFTHRVKTIKRFKVVKDALTYGEIKASDIYKDIKEVLSPLGKMNKIIKEEKAKRDAISLNHFEYISDKSVREYKEIENLYDYMECKKIMDEVLLDIYDYIKKNYSYPQRDVYMVPLKNPTVYFEKGYDDIISIIGGEEEYRKKYAISLRLHKNYIHVDFDRKSLETPSIKSDNIMMIPVSSCTNYKYIFDNIEKIKELFTHIPKEDKKVEIKSLVYFNKRGNCAIFNKDTEVCKDMTIVIMKQYEDILNSIKLVIKDNKDALYILKDPVEVYIDEKEHAIKIRNQRYCSLFGVAEYITIDYSYDKIKSKYIKKVDFEIVDRKPLPDLIIKVAKARDIYLGETIERSIDKSKVALNSMYLEKVKFKRKDLKTEVNSLTVREEKTDNTIKEKFYKASEVLEDENINSYFNNLKYIFEPLLKEPIDIDKVDYILENANISLLKKSNGEYIITLTQEVTDCIVGLIQESIEIVKRGDFLRYYFVKTDTLVGDTQKEELFELHLNERDKKYPAAVSVWNRLDLTLHGLLGYYIQEEESETTNKIDIKCIKYEDEDEVIHKFEDKEWKDNKSYKFIKEKIMSVLCDFRNIKINSENLKDLLKDALVEIKYDSRYSFRIYPSKNPKSKYKSWIIARIERGGISFKYTTVNSLDYSDIEKDCHLYYLPIEKYNSDLYYLIPDLIKVFENIKYDKAITIKNIYKELYGRKKTVAMDNRLSSYIACQLSEIVYINNEPFLPSGEYDVAISGSCGLKFLYIRKSDDLNYKYDILISNNYIELSSISRSTITENEAGIQGEYYRKIKKICDSIIEEINKYSYIEEEEDEELEEITEENGMKVIITEDSLIKALERADEYTKDYKGDFVLDKLEQKEINSKYQIILYYSEGE